ncbi:hypothetical protein DUNSADRAFT_17870 [Dunaliella salina]|uniref:Uncharacterized protein n=1 Tax=Dunaliella salina TaxID=3046 RepID=A0ABQ7G100_DUNSA|nr:hypothetical protein DUNSADRAFT_17870 [Dunaliella salina]|eukprot:KAF5828276.1 hypothetical protein DUNSADRAFT_17870 [Dunaliella salina]
MILSAGHVNDEIQITVPPLIHQPKVPQVINPHAVLQLGLNTQEAGVLGTEKAEDAQAAADAAAGRLHEPKHVPGSKFRQLAAKFLHPFNLDVSSANKQLVGVLHDIKSSHQNGSGGAAAGEGSRPLSRPTKSMQRSISVSMQQKSHLTRQTEGFHEQDGSLGTDGEEMRKIQTDDELIQELIVTPDVILILQTQLEGALLEWHTHTAAETLKGRLTDNEFQATLELLVSDSSIEFFITLINFMHEEFIRGSPHFPHDLVRKLRRKGGFTAGTFPSQRSSSQRTMSRRASFRTSAMGGSGKSIKQLEKFAEHDLGWRVWCAERAYACKQAEIEAEREAASLEAKKFSSTAGGLYQNATSRPQRSPLANPFQARMPGPPTNSVQPNMSGLALPRSLRPASPFLSPAALASPVVTAQVPSRTHPRIQQTYGSNRGAQSSISFGPDDHLAAETRTQDYFSDSRPLSSSSASSRSSTPEADPSSARSATKRPKPVTTHDHLDAQDVRELQQARLFVLQREFNALYKRLRGTRSGLFFTLPVFLVACRLLVHLLFHSLFRLWMQSDEGADALEKMDESIVYLFDPSGYLQRNLSILESTPAAVSIMAKHPQLGHGPERTHMSDVSPLVRAAMQQPASHQARKLLAEGAKHRPSRHSTNTNRVVNAAGAAAVAGADVPFDFSFQGPSFQQQQQHQGWLPCPLHTKLSLEQTDALYREAHAGLVQDTMSQRTEQQLPSLPRRRDRCMPALKKKS